MPMTEHGPLRHFDEIAQGMILPQLSLTITRADLVRYAGAADDYIPQHWDQPMMLAAGFDDVVVHGWLCFAHMCRCVTNWAPPAIATIAAYRVRYLSPLYPGELTCGGLVNTCGGNEARLELWASNALDVKVTVADVTLRRC